MSGTQRRGWLYRVPPLRGPRRHHHHGRYHHHSDAAQFGRFLLWFLAAILWIYEFEIWLTVWIYYGLFVAGRAAVRAIQARRAAPTALPMAPPYVAPSAPQDARPSRW